MFHPKRPAVTSVQPLCAAIMMALLHGTGHAQQPAGNTLPIAEQGPGFAVVESFNTGSTGYLLALTKLSPGLHLAVTEDVGPAQPIPGAPSQRTFRFVASKPNVAMTLAHFRPWDTSDMRSSNYSISVAQVEPVMAGTVQSFPKHVEPEKLFQIKVDDMPQLQLVLHTMTEGIYLVRTEAEAPAQPVPGATGSRVFHFFAAPGFVSGKVAFAYYAPGKPQESVVAEYDVRTTNSDFDRLGVVCRPTPQGEGLELLDVAAGSPAEEYRLRKGDVILSVNAEDTNSVDSYLKLLSRPGPFFHVRGRYANGKPFEFTCQLPVTGSGSAPGTP